MSTKKTTRISQANRLGLVCLSFLLYIGCASTGTTIDPQGNKWTTKVSGNAKYSLKTDTFETKLERKPLIETPQVGDIKLIRKED